MTDHNKKTQLEFLKPRWLRDLLRFAPLKSQFVLSGNVRDLQACEVSPGIVTAQSLASTLCDGLRESGYTQFIVWNPLTGFAVSAKGVAANESPDQLLSSLGLVPVNGMAPGGIDSVGAVMGKRSMNHSLVA